MAGKRKSDVASTGDDLYARSGPVPKSSRTDSTLNTEKARSGQRFGESVDYIPLDQDTSPGQRFGEAVDFIPLNQLSQVFGADEEDEEALNVVQGSQEVDETSLTSSILYGERVIINRDAHNKYDSNAIRVDNVMGAQIGHVPRQMAAKLASYIDARDLIIEGTLTGVIGAYVCPVDLKLFGTRDPTKRSNLKQRMQNDRLPVRQLNELEREERKAEKAAEKQQKEVAKKARAIALGKAASQWQANQNSEYANLSTPTGLGGEQNESLEELLSQSSTFNPRDIGQVVETFGQKESDMVNMPMVDTPAGLSTQLLPYQRQGLAWMIKQESPSLPERGSGDIVQLWKRENNEFLNVATNYATATEPALASGGILADDMGLGKTIQVISLILANAKPLNAGSSKTTLIIAPVGVMSNWRNQIQDHAHKETAPSVLIYHGSGKKEAANLAKYDVVITSYGALALDFNPNANKAPVKGIFSLHWRRVVLDEGHIIRNPSSKASLAACGLRADSRWTLTGTPIINTLKDLYAQVRFLKLSGGLEDLGIFNSVLIRPLTSGEPEARLLLEALMGTICLRRRKDMGFINLKLPEMTSRVIRIKFNAHEREKYSAFQTEAQGALLDFKDKDGKTKYSHLLEVLLRLRQVCNHWALCKNRIDKLMGVLEEHKVVPLTPENVRALQEMLQLQIESQEMCAICLDNLDQPVITACAHSYCRGCIEQVIERQHKCPLCRADINETSTLVSPAVELSEDTDTIEADHPNSPSSKIETLVKILTAQGQAPGTKTVVFSQWTSFLDLIEPHLQQRGVKFARVDGKMQSVKRDNSINSFSSDTQCTILLASLSVCSVGLNLVAANQVILCDSWWAPAIEDQAVDRVYRLGQKRETTVWRLVMEDSIEERVLAIQERKRRLMLAAFRETAKKKAEDRGTRVADLEALLQ
ncbi:putative SWI/SNF-related matrix-associated actin-dependent regulator of chromatin subfamily A member 3-like [Penicillium chrysogenum]|uniref:Putative SWI/SNF-related matrix-associated actin-dependent regulator of chromatin subfamily A member 3-like n=1 Tax=Penicillium chrysogenum TaxID=5076 RepID=A0A167UJU7_PENCH|nr:putative SWI/SNF-related matrix-associated actin-dependent regulator of chromatin subfamily A member 3-like [Penicillium chrysogenum]